MNQVDICKCGKYRISQYAVDKRPCIIYLKVESAIGIVSGLELSVFQCELVNDIFLHKFYKHSNYGNY